MHLRSNTFELFMKFVRLARDLLNPVDYSLFIKFRYNIVMIITFYVLLF
jgi:hypothetical protein